MSLVESDDEEGQASILDLLEDRAAEALGKLVGASPSRSEGAPRGKGTHKGAAIATGKAKQKVG